MKKIFTLLIILYSQQIEAQDVININGTPCGLTGDAVRADVKALNPFKNRYNLPSQNDFNSSITLQTLIGNGTPDSGDFNMNEAVTVVGWVDSVRFGGKETCNCHTDDSRFTDTHIELVLGPSDHGNDRKKIIVEITPRLRAKMKAQNIDWSSANIKSTFEHHFVSVSGWLLFDQEHKQESFSYDPNDNIGKKNWRATCWEIHPITSISLVQDNAVTASSTTNEDDDISSGNIPGSSDNTTNNNINNISNNTTMNTTATPLGLLIYILLGAILGTSGQVFRIVVGIKKAKQDAAAANKPFVQDNRQLLLSLLIAVIVGGVAGVLAGVNSMGNLNSIDKSTVIAFIAAGYAGTDLIEGFVLH